MILGVSISMFTLFHVFLSFVGILAGLVVVWAMLRSPRALRSLTRVDSMPPGPS